MATSVRWCQVFLGRIGLVWTGAIVQLQALVGAGMASGIGGRVGPGAISDDAAGPFYGAPLLNLAFGRGAGRDQTLDIPWRHIAAMEFRIALEAGAAVVYRVAKNDTSGCFDRSEPVSPSRVGACPVPRRCCFGMTETGPGPYQSLVAPLMLRVGSGWAAVEMSWGGRLGLCRLPERVYAVDVESGVLRRTLALVVFWLEVFACLIIGACLFRVGVISLRCAWRTGEVICWRARLQFCGRRCDGFWFCGRFGWMPGWFCRIICMPFGRCRRAMRISPGVGC